MRRQHLLLKDKVAIVTGGAMGIGRGIALKFAEEGCAVVVADISEAEGIKTANDLSRQSKDSFFVSCDVTSSNQVQELVNKSINKFGKVDILVNNAGGVPQVIQGGSIVDITDQMWDTFLNLNLRSAFFGCRAVVPYMKEKKYGKIINLSSIGAIQPSASVIHYHSAKAGILGLTHNLAFDLAPYNVCVNSIMPGPIRTPFWEPVTRGIPDKDAFFSALAKTNVPMERIGTPEDVAGAALFLASELSAYVTGENICVAGGIPLLPHDAVKMKKD
jgi:NAD(P)-dependent dehydrogenase (short-subunit alcohol dehydrogenase family)